MSPRFNFRSPVSASGRTPRRRTNRGSALAVMVVVAATIAVSCSTDASTRTSAAADEKPPAAKSVATLEPVPAGTTLRVGDQVEYLQTVLSLSGQDKDFPYARGVRRRSSAAHPCSRRSRAARSTPDSSPSTPLIFAQAAGQDIVAIAGWASEHGAGARSPPIPTSRAGPTWMASVSPTSGAPRPKRACSRRSIGERHRSVRDHHRSTCPSHRSRPRIKGGSADAGHLHRAVDQPVRHRDAGRPDGGAGQRGHGPQRTSSSRPSEALDDRARSAALAEYTTRVVVAFTYLAAHSENCWPSRST